MRRVAEPPHEQRGDRRAGGQMNADNDPEPHPS
jgi:hypothetical protein